MKNLKVLPMGEVKKDLTLKMFEKMDSFLNSILIVLRMNTDIEIWDQNRKRLFE